MSRALLACSLIILVLGASTSSAESPAKAPEWLQAAVKNAVAQLESTSVTAITYINPSGRFPRAVATGRFVCSDCSGPVGAKAPTGTLAEYRFDGLTHHATDFALCPKAKGCGSSLCGGSRCTPTRDALDAAFAALAARLDKIAINPEPFWHETGTHPCHIYYPSRDGRYLPGICTTTVRLLSSQAAAVTFTEQWRPREYEHGQWVRLSTHTHEWTVTETRGGWATKVSSIGDAPPQLPAGTKV